MLGEKPPWLGQDEEVQQKIGKAEIAAKMEGLVMSWWKIAFCIAGYLFAFAAVSGLYGGKSKSDPFEDFLVGLFWPFYIVWLPLHAVYKSVKEQMTEQVERANKAAEPSVPPGKFRIGSCETCTHAEPYDDAYMTCSYCEDLGIARAKDGWCNEYSNTETGFDADKRERQKWDYKDYAAALFLDCMGYNTLCKMTSGRVHASANGKDPFFLPFDLFLPLEVHKCVRISDVIKQAEENRKKGMKWREEE